MNKIQFKEIKSEKIEKNNLYKVSDSKVVTFEENHTGLGTKEVVNIRYKLDKNQYGFYATEYRPACIQKGCKTTDILAGIVDDDKKAVYTLICDVKSNISAFSDDLSKGDALLTVIKEVRDFIEQIKAGMLHKKSFMIYYEADGYTEVCETAIATKNFENQKFFDAAEMLEKILDYDERQTTNLNYLRMRNNLKNYKCEISKLKKFGEEVLLIDEDEYKLSVYILQPDKDKKIYKKDIDFEYCKNAP